MNTLLDTIDNAWPHYILDANKQPVKVTMREWMQWYIEKNRRVAWTNIYEGCAVSTIFLGTDYQHDGSMFETYVFGGPMAYEQHTYATWREAEAGHAAIVERVLMDNTVMAKVLEELEIVERT